MKYTESEIEEKLEKIVRGDEVTDDPVIRRLVREYLVHRANHTSKNQAVIDMRGQLRQLEEETLVLEGKTNATADLLRKFYTKSLEDSDDRNNQSNDGDNEASNVEVARQPVHGAEDGDGREDGDGSEPDQSSDPGNVH